MSVKTRETTVRLPPEVSPRRRGAARRVIDRPGVQTLAALLLYLITSLLFFGIPVLRDIKHSYVGLGRPGLGTGFTDPSVYIWSLLWWPHALTHGMNPLFTHLVWAPGGVHLGWTTTVPAASILAWPVTAWLGPVASYNVWMLLALALIPRVRAALMRTAGWTALSYGAAAVVLAPFVLALAGGSGFVPSTWPSRYSTDLLNLVVPTRISLLAPSAAGGIASRFAAGLSEEGAYLGPLLIVVVLFAIGAIRTRAGQLLLGALGLIVLASLGPSLLVAGTERIPMPWAVTAKLPVVRMALPARFMLYAWLVVGVLAAVWLAAPSRRAFARWGKWALAVLCLLALLPNLTLPLWDARTDTPVFFSTDLHRRFLEPGRNTLVIPFASNGFSMLWQAEADMSFPMTGGYIACAIPRDYRHWAIVASFLSKRRVPRYDIQLQAFLGHFDVANVVVDPRAEGPWRRVFGKIPVRPAEVGGVLYYRVPDRLLAEYRHRPRPLNVAWRALQRDCQ